MIAVLMLFAACLIGPTSVSAQDIGQLLQAVDKLEASLKTLVGQEAAKRSAEIAKLQKQMKALANGQPAERDRTELAALRAEISKLSESIGNSSADASQGADQADNQPLREEIEILKMEIQSLKDQLSAGSVKMASMNASTPQNVSLASGSKAGSPGPKYNNLRFKDNYSYLNNSKNRGNDIFDPLKRISMGGASELSFGGQYRFRYESDQNRKFSSTPVGQEVYLNRLFLFADLKIVNNRFRLFTEFKYAGIRNNDMPAPAIAHDRPDIENLFIDGWVIRNSAAKLGMRIGRQELQFGKQRLISPLDWANTRRTFEGLRVMSSFNGWALDGFVTRPVNVDVKEFNTPDQARLFSGIYATKKLGGNTLSGYFLVYTKDAPINLATGLSGDFEYLTLGTGFDGKAGRFDWSGETAFQFGSLGDKNISAYMVSLNGGYKFQNHALKPRLGVSWDVASGDKDPTDNKVQTFHQQFPLGHAYFGWADQVGRRNINAVSVQLSAKPSSVVTTKLNWFSFGLMEKKDALYNAGGAASRQDATGASGRHVGNEIDALIILKLNRHASFHLGYLHFKPGKFIKNTGDGESHNMLYMMLPIKF